MPLRIFSLPLLAALLLAGCTSAPAPAGKLAPAAAPTGPVPAGPAKVALPPASIRGSQESSTLLDNFTAFIIAVDGRAVTVGRKGWNQPVSLTAGQHRLAVEFNRGVFIARTELPLDAKSGAAYELRYASDAQVYGGHSYCEFWVVDLATGEKATAVKRIGLSNVKGG
jgi:hypothetical protein